MSVTISNTNLTHNFNTWRTNTNLLSDAMSNNVVTVWRGGANRGGKVTGNGHISGTFSSTNLRTSVLKGGNTTVGSSITISSNTTVDGTSLAISANTTFTGNVNFTSVGTDRIILGDASRIRLTGGSNNNIMVQNNSDEIQFTADPIANSITIAAGNVQTLLDAKENAGESADQSIAMSIALG
jgi:hypothetical protein